jgi:hypothetical protein
MIRQIQQKSALLSSAEPIVPKFVYKVNLHMHVATGKSRGKQHESKRRNDFHSLKYNTNRQSTDGRICFSGVTELCSTAKRLYDFEQQATEQDPQCRADAASLTWTMSWIRED